MSAGVHPHPRHVPERGDPGLLAHPVPPASGDFRWVYLWQAPLRAMHWLAAGSLVLLVVTGFWIGRPWFLPQVQLTGGFATQWVRLAHFVAAGVLCATTIVRVYWLFAGNRFERLPALFPVRRRELRNLWRQVQYYLFWHPERAPHYLGHNPLQQLSYTFLYLSVLLMIATGFALYGQASPEGVIRAATAWIAPAMGGMQNVRIVHHVAAWWFIVFPILHVYLSIRSDVMEQSGAISSIVTGGKFVPADEVYADDASAPAEDPAPRGAPVAPHV